MANNIPIVDINCFGTNISIDSFAYNAIAWAKKNLTPQQKFFCPCIGADIQVSNKGIYHTVYQKKRDQKNNYNHETIALVSLLKELIMISELRYNGQDRYGSENVKFIKMIKSPVLVNGVVRNVELLVKEMWVDRKKDISIHVFYNHVFIDEIKK